MQIPVHADPDDPAQQRERDRRRGRRALNAALAAVLALLAIHAAVAGVDVRAWTVQPGVPEGLRGLLTAPLLHGSWAHVGANAIALLLLGALAGTVYPRAVARALPLLWLGSGLGAWVLGTPGTYHLGASGVTHGLTFLLLALGLLRRDRA
ncbi:MAG TPA: rhomboid family intramembrane serine protease, partial [Lysobacter sp.]|nr:rhomboid family intramembrane serine protease [Lysobacter sp.]